MKQNNVKVLMINAIVAALYVVITTVFAFMSFGNIQFRISEMLKPFYLSLIKSMGMGLLRVLF